MKPTIKKNYEMTIHNDGTASIWDCINQQWRRLSIASILIERHDLFASLSDAERARLNQAFAKLSK